jgi:hypothetical protein
VSAVVTSLVSRGRAPSGGHDKSNVDLQFGACEIRMHHTS